MSSWNPDLCGTLSAWCDPIDGLTYVIDGHHRRALAQKLGVPRVAVRFLSAPDASSGRVAGALINISQKNSTPIDAANLLRITGMGPQAVSGYGVALGGRSAARKSGLDEYHAIGVHAFSKFM